MSEFNVDELQSDNVRLAELAQNSQQEIEKLRKEAKEFRDVLQKSINSKLEMEHKLKAEISKLRAEVETAQKDAADLREGLGQNIKSKNELAEKLLRENERLQTIKEHANVLEEKHRVFVDSACDHLGVLGRQFPGSSEVHKTRREVNKLEDAVDEFLASFGVQLDMF